MMEEEYAPEPICRAHGMRITECKSCCDRLYFEAGDLRPDIRHAWAVKNLYVVS